MSSHFEMMRLEMADMPMRCRALSGIPALYKKVKKAWGGVEFLSLYEVAMADKKLPQAVLDELENLRATMKHYPRLVIREGATEKERAALLAAVGSLGDIARPVLPFTLR